MKLTIAGSGDAFASGGRFNSCYHVRTSSASFLIDCGATSLLALRRVGLVTNDISTIFISHLHGDHFGGLPFVYIDALHPSKRTAPLTIAGPRGTEERCMALAEAMFAGVTKAKAGFSLRFVVIEPNAPPLDIDGTKVTALEMLHESGAPSLALRFEADGRTLAFSGDTGWTENVVEAGREADLYLLECYQYDLKLPMHIDYQTLSAHLNRIDAHRIVLTHMHDLMLAQAGEVDQSRCILAEDGMVIDV
jgi:ribonuclease BN (tRNA processing enzyme)